jgi:TonB family protein
MKCRISAFIAILFAAVSVAFAQEKAPVTADVYFFGMRQATVIDLPLPEYPPAALRAGYGGRVTVNVVIDENGTVAAIGEVHGPRSGCKHENDVELIPIRLAATNAAARARFKVTAEGEHFVAISAQISYMFVPGLGDAGAPTRADSPPLPGDNGKESVKTKAVVRNSEPAGLAANGERIPPPPPPPPGSEPRGGVVNGIAILLPKPKYPAEAKAAGARGTVVVHVFIDESGSVISTRAVSGNPLLLDAAETAACSARFTPTLLSGKPVKVWGSINYNFVP